MMHACVAHVTEHRQSVPMRWTAVVLVALHAVVSSGCGDAKPERVTVTGTIKLDGKPVPSGAISFIPLEGGASAGATFNDGAFSIPRANGPSPGRYRVEIDSYQSTGETIPDSDLIGRTNQRTRQIIPAKYNRESTLVVDVKRDGNEPFQFELRSK